MLWATLGPLARPHSLLISRFEGCNKPIEGLPSKVICSWQCPRSKRDAVQGLSRMALQLSVSTSVAISLYPIASMFCLLGPANAMLWTAGCEAGAGRLLGGSSIQAHLTPAASACIHSGGPGPTAVLQVKQSQLADSQHLCTTMPCEGITS